MNEHATITRQMFVIPAPITTPSGLSSARHCACGGIAGLDGECSACRARRLSSKPASFGGATPPARSTREAGDSIQGLHLGHDFGRVPLRAGPSRPAGPAMPVGLAPAASSRARHSSSPPSNAFVIGAAPEEQTEGEDQGLATVVLTTALGPPVIERRTTPQPAGGGSGPTVPSDGGAAPAPAPPAPAPAAQCECAEGLDMKESGAIEGAFGISQYWPGVTSYWGADKTLGQFDTTASGGGHTYGHKFQVVGRFSRQTSGSTGGHATFQQMARLTVGTAPGGTAGSWFDDMDYTDAGGADHHWDPNAEAGTTTRAGYPGVRRTIATDKYAYTDPPAIFYQPGTTNSYRKLEFRISFRSATGCPCPIISITLPRVQEIQVTKGVPRTLAYPYP